MEEYFMFQWGAVCFSDGGIFIFKWGGEGGEGGAAPHGWGIGFGGRGGLKRIVR